MAPPKHGVKNGIVPASAQPSEQDFLFSQLTNSIVKLVQANKKPTNKTINCPLIRFFIHLHYTSFGLFFQANKKAPRRRGFQLL